MTKKQKLKKAKKDKELWGDQNSLYFNQLSNDCSEQESIVLEHEPIDHCKKEKQGTEKKKEKKIKKNSGSSVHPEHDDEESTLEKLQSFSALSTGYHKQESKTKKNKQLSNSDYLEILESSLDEEERILFNRSQVTNFADPASSTQSAFTSQNVSRPLWLAVNSTTYSSGSDQAEIIVKLLKDLDSSFELFKVQDDSIMKQMILENMVIMIDSLSRKCFRKEDRNTIFVLGGLNFACALISFFASQENENEHYENIMNSLSYILYRFSDHNRARSAMLTAGVFYSLWYVGGLSKNVSTISHVNEVVNLLGGQLSIGYELSNLLKRSNSHLLDLEYISGDENAVDSMYSDSNTFPDTFLGIGTEYESLSENNFPVHIHFSILTARTMNFLSEFCVMWEPTTGEVLQYSKRPGFYLMKDSRVSWYSLLKFIQLLYTDKISISKKERERVLKNDNKLLESKLISEGFPLLLTTLRNQKTRENAINCMNIFSSMEIQNESNTVGLFDEFDNELVKDELNYFFGKPAVYFYLPANTNNTFTTEFLRKKEKIRQQATLLSGLEQDLGFLFMDMMSSQTVEREETKTLLFHTNVKILLTDTLGEIDYIMEEKIQSYPILKNIIDCKGFYLHKSIIATRSEFMKKLMQYELERQDGMDVCYINNFSLSTLFTVFQYIPVWWLE